MLAAVLFAVARPYKKVSNNVMEVVFLIYLAICFNIQSEVLFSKVYENNHYFFLHLFTILLYIPIIYPVCLVLSFLYHSSLAQDVSGWFVHRKSEELVDSTFLDRARYGSTA